MVRRLHISIVGSGPLLCLASQNQLPHSRSAGSQRADASEAFALRPKGSGIGERQVAISCLLLANNVRKKPIPISKKKGGTYVRIRSSNGSKPFLW
jgi:hypothetical protein